MSVSRISFCANPPQKINTTQPETKSTGDVKSTAPNMELKLQNKAAKEKSSWEELGIKKPHPAVIGVGSAVLWFAIGALLDKGISKIWKSYQYNRNFSLKINAGFGVIMGAIDAYKANAANKK